MILPGYQQINGHCVCSNAFEYTKVYGNPAVGIAANDAAE